MRLHTLEAQLAEQGFLFHHQRGSHRIYRRASCGGHLCITVHGGAHTALSWRQVAAIRKELAQLEPRATTCAGHEENATSQASGGVRNT